MDEALERILETRIRVERERRSAPSAHRLGRVLEDFPGGSRNSRYAIEVSRVAAEELDTRVEAWLEIARNVFLRVGQAWTEAATSSARLVLESAVRADFEELYGVLIRLVGDRRTDGDLSRARDRAPRRIESELETLRYAEEQHRIPLADQLMAPRYKAVRAARQKAEDLLSTPDPDWSGAAKEMVGSVEQLARIVVQDPTSTLGDAVKTLRGNARVRAPLLKGIEELWGWTSTEDGVRHGGRAGPLDEKAARKVIRDSESALLYLLEVDLD